MQAMSPGSGPADQHALMAAHAHELTLLEGDRVLIRPVLPSDKEELEEGFTRLSQESRYFRFFSHLDRLTTEQLRYLTEIDYHDHFALAAFALDEPDHPGIGVARYVRSPNTDADAELAVAVIDDYHGRGVGVALIRLLADIAVQHGVARFVAYVLRENRAMRGVFAFLGATTRADEPGVLQASLDLPLGPIADEAAETTIRRIDAPDS